MMDVKLPDGTWVTTPMWAGIGLMDQECASHQWVAEGPVREPEGPGQMPIQLERCTVCKWVRGRYLENPHPGE